MKFKLLLVLMLLSPRTILGETAEREQVESLKEDYVPIWTVEAKWGKGDREFGLYNEYGLIDAPRIFHITANSDVYLLDPVNRKIIVYDDNGVYKSTVKLEMQYRLPTDEVGASLYVDSKGNIYISNEFYNFFVEKFSSDGRLIKRFVVYTPSYEGNIELYRKFITDERTVLLNKRNVIHNGVGIYTDNKEDVYLSVSTGEEGKPGKEESLRISDNDSISDWKEIGNVMHRGAYVKDQGDNHIKLLFNESDKDKCVEYNIELPPENNYLKEKYKDVPKVSYYQEDIYHNLYLGRWHFRHEKYCSGEIYKFDKSGKLLSSIDAWKYSGQNSRIKIDDHGNIYQLVTDNMPEGGLRLIKWRVKK